MKILFALTLSFTFCNFAAFAQTNCRVGQEYLFRNDPYGMLKWKLCPVDGTACISVENSTPVRVLALNQLYGAYVDILVSAQLPPKAIENRDPDGKITSCAIAPRTSMVGRLYLERGTAIQLPLSCDFL